MRISPATPADIPALCGLLSELFSQETEFTPDPVAQRRGLTRILADPDIGTILVAQNETAPPEAAILGMVSLLYTVSTALGERVALLEDMIVVTGARGNGVGSRLLAGAIATARATGCKRITLLTDTTNDHALRFYAKHGFRPSPMMPLRLMLA